MSILSKRCRPDLRGAVLSDADAATNYDEIPGVCITNGNVALWQQPNRKGYHLTVRNLRDARAALSTAGGNEVKDTWLVGGADLKAMSGDVESDHVIKLHFRRRASGADRVWLLEAINAKIAADRLSTGDEATKSEGVLPLDVVRLVIAARVVAFEDQSESAIRELDKASEQFADRVPWDDEPEIGDVDISPNDGLAPAHGRLRQT